MKKIILINMMIINLLIGQEIFDKNKEDFNYAESLIKVVMTEKMKKFSSEYKSGNQNSGYLLSLELYNKGYYNQSGEILTLLITEKDVPEAFTLLGEHFLYGRGVKKDCLKAGLFFSGGISAGDCNAYMKIHDQYIEAICLTENKYKAKKYLKAYGKCIEGNKNGIIKAKKINNKMVIQ